MPGVDPVNAALRSVVLGDLAQNRRGAEAQAASGPPPTDGAHGEYGGHPLPAATSVSSRVVSTMAAMHAVSPDGNDGDYWLSANLFVPSGRPIGWSDLFSNVHAGLTAIAAAAKTYFTTTSDPAAQCVRQDLAADTLGVAVPLFLQAIAPVLSKLPNMGDDATWPGCRVRAGGAGRRGVRHPDSGPAVGESGSSAESQRSRDRERTTVMPRARRESVSGSGPVETSTAVGVRPLDT